MSLERIERIRNHKDFDNIDALILTKPENITYVLGFNIESETSILIPNNNSRYIDQKIIVFLNILEYDQVKEKVLQTESLDKQFELIKIDSSNKKILQNKLKEMNLKTIGFEDNYITVKNFKEWKEKFKGIEFLGVSEIINEARLIKTDKEIENIKKAADLGIIGFNTIYESIEEGKTEKELAAEAEYAMRKAGSDGTSFETIVASGNHSAFPHAKTSKKQVKKGDLIIVDIGARYNGYCSDMTRTFIFNGKNSKYYSKKAELVNIVNECEEYVLEKIKSGEKAAEMDKLARDFFKSKKKGWSSRFIHSLGHGVGIDIHENPYLAPNSEEILKKGMCVTIEPGLYIPELGGARTEDLIIIKKNGFKSLSNMKKFYY